MGNHSAVSLQKNSISCRGWFVVGRSGLTFSVTLRPDRIFLDSILARDFSHYATLEFADIFKKEKLVKMIGIVSDHGGFSLKNYLFTHLQKEFSILDLGVASEVSVDYPVIIGNACKRLLSGEFSSLIALCGTGIGASITANRFKGIRAALCHDEFTAEMSKRHNNANVLVLGGRVLGSELALRISMKWHRTEFEGGRHANRIQLLDV